MTYEHLGPVEKLSQVFSTTCAHSPQKHRCWGMASPRNRRRELAESWLRALCLTRSPIVILRSPPQRHRLVHPMHSLRTRPPLREQIPPLREIPRPTTVRIHTQHQPPIVP